MDLNGPSNSQVQRIWSTNMERAFSRAMKGRQEDVRRIAQRIQDLFLETNRCVKGNWVCPDIYDIIKVLNESD